MNRKEHHLPELELSTGQVREALQCLLHTILFVRAPGAVTPRDVECEGFDLTYARIAGTSTSSSAGPHKESMLHVPNLQHPTTVSGGGMQYNNYNNNQQQQPTTIISDVDQKVDDSIELLLRTLTQIGPELLSGCIILSFFERRTTNQLFGLVSHEERVIWEQWIIRVVVNNTPRPIGNDDASVIERQRIQDTAEGMLRTALFRVFDIVGGTINHIPPVQYEFDISCTGTNINKQRNDDRENVYSRVTNMPPMLHLG